MIIRVFMFVIPMCLCVCGCSIIKYVFTIRKIGPEIYQDEKSIAFYKSNIDKDSSGLMVYVYDCLTDDPYEYAYIEVCDNNSRVIEKNAIGEYGKYETRLHAGYYYVTVKFLEKELYDSVQLLGGTNTVLRIGLGGEIIR